MVDKKTVIEMIKELKRTQRRVEFLTASIEAAVRELQSELSDDDLRELMKELIWSA
jgi:hypothetical protein